MIFIINRFTRVEFRRDVALELRVNLHVVDADAPALRRSQQRVEASARVARDEELEGRGGEVGSAPAFRLVQHVGVPARGGEHLKLGSLDESQDDLRRVRSFRHGRLLERAAGPLVDALDSSRDAGRISPRRGIFPLSQRPFKKRGCAP